MIARRIIYILLLLGAAAYYIFNSSYFSWLLLVLVLSFVPLELLLTLPLWLGLRLQYHASRSRILQGETIALRITLCTRLPGATVLARLHCKNLFDGSVTKLRLKLRPYTDEPFVVEVPSDVCGVVRCSLKRPRMMDVVGLFALPLLDAPRPVQVLVLPLPVEPPTLPPAGGWRTASPTQQTARPGPGSVRDFSDIREYREGDSVRDIHWKLSAKLDKLIIREASAPQSTALNVAYDHFGRANEVCHTLARLQALSGAMWEMERPHKIITFDEGDTLQNFVVETPSDMDAFLWERLSKPLPGQGIPVMEHMQELPDALFLVQAQAITLYKDGAAKEVLT